MANQVSSVDVPLSIFGSLNTELSPPDIPEGCSPANNDVVYLPGSVATRPGINRIFASPFAPVGPISYQKSFVTPTGDIKNLYFTQGDGNLWVEDVTNSPGTVTNLFGTAGATYASSCTAQGREYISLSDGMHGADIPLCYDGTNLWRVTQGGPAAPPLASSVALPSVAMTTITGASTSVTSITTSGYDGTFYLSITLTVTSTSGFAKGMPIGVTGNSYTAFNSQYTIDSIPDGVTIICGTFQGTASHTGTGGTCSQIGTTLSRTNNTVTGYTASAHQLQVGYQVQIQGAGTSVVNSISSIVLNNARRFT